MALLAPMPKQRFFTNGNLPAAGYKLTTYTANTTNLLATYSNRAGTVANPNPITLDANGECVMYLASGQVYDFKLETPAGAQEWLREDIEADPLAGDLATAGDGKGADLVKVVQLGANAATRTQQERNRDRLSVLDFIGYNLSLTAGKALRDRIQARTATTGDKADILLGVQAACAAANARGGVSVHFPAGKYWLDNLDLTGMHGLALVGDGPEATQIVTNSATADVFKTTAETRYLTLADMTVTSSVTRTAGAYFSLAGWKRGLLSHVRMTGWFNAVFTPSFEQCTLFECYITAPSGLGDALITGTQGSAGQGANLNVLNCFIRGNDDATGGNPVGRYGIAIYDVDAIFGFNTDIGGFVECDTLIAPNTRSANHHFVQCYLDATKNSACLHIQGTGTKQQITYNGCWFSSAGKLTGGSVEACGLRALNTGSYQDVIFADCRFYNNSGSGALLEMPGADIHFPGSTFYANGLLATTNRHGLKWVPASAATVGPGLSGTRFSGNGPKDIYIGANAAGKGTLQSVHSESGIDQLAATGKASGYDATTTTYASALTLTVSPLHDYISITGTTNIGGIAPTYKGHLLTMDMTASLVVLDNNQNLRLAGNFSAVSGSTLTLRCDGAEWKEVARSNN